MYQPYIADNKREYVQTWLCVDCHLVKAIYASEAKQEQRFLGKEEISDSSSDGGFNILSWLKDKVSPE